MKRALVWQAGTRWHVCHVKHGRLVGDCASYPTHAEALTHALAEVGLSTTDTKETTR